MKTVPLVIMRSFKYGSYLAPYLEVDTNQVKVRVSIIFPVPGYIRKKKRCYPSTCGHSATPQNTLFWSISEPPEE